MKKKNTDKDNLKNSYLLCQRFLAESKNYILFSIYLFTFAVVFGIFLNTTPEMTGKILDYLKQIVAQFNGLNLPQTILYLFWNNLSVCIITIFSGVLLCIIPFIIGLSNGFVLGFVAKHAVSLDGLTVIWRLFPHGIFELPAIIISLGLSFKLGVEIFTRREIRHNLREIFRIIFLIIVPLLFIAAIIEGSLIFLFR